MKGCSSYGDANCGEHDFDGYAMTIVPCTGVKGTADECENADGAVTMHERCRMHPPEYSDWSAFGR